MWGWAGRATAATSPPTPAPSPALRHSLCREREDTKSLGSRVRQAPNAHPDGGQGGVGLTQLDVAATLTTPGPRQGASPSPASLFSGFLQSWPGASRGALRLPATGLEPAPPAGAGSAVLAQQALVGDSEL